MGNSSDSDVREVNRRSKLTSSVAPGLIVGPIVKDRRAGSGGHSEGSASPSILRHRNVKAVRGGNFTCTRGAKAMEMSVREVSGSNNVGSAAAHGIWSCRMRNDVSALISSSPGGVPVRESQIVSDVSAESRLRPSKVLLGSETNERERSDGSEYSGRMDGTVMRPKSTEVSRLGKGSANLSNWTEFSPSACNAGGRCN